MRLPEHQRAALKAPLGVLLPDSEVSAAGVMRMIPDGSYVVTVGDRTTERLIGFDIIPSLQITDGLERRRPRPHPDLAGGKRGGRQYVATLMRVDNPPAEVTQESIDAIRRAFSAPPPVRIHVNGEEDLLVLPACLHAPEGATVLYGQPGEGLVITAVTQEVRNKSAELLGLMGGT